MKIQGIFQNIYIISQLRLLIYIRFLCSYLLIMCFYDGLVETVMGSCILHTCLNYGCFSSRNVWFSRRNIYVIIAFFLFYIQSKTYIILSKFLWKRSFLTFFFFLIKLARSLNRTIWIIYVLKILKNIINASVYTYSFI